MIRGSEFVYFAKLRSQRLNRIGTARGCPLVVGVGALETDEFRRQSREFAAAWQARGLDCRLVEMVDRHHYSITADLSDPDGPLAAPFLERIRAGVKAPA